MADARQATSSMPRVVAKQSRLDHETWSLEQAIAAADARLAQLESRWGLLNAPSPSSTVPDRGEGRATLGAEHTEFDPKTLHGLDWDRGRQRSSAASSSSPPIVVQGTRRGSGSVAAVGILALLYLRLP